MKKKRTFDWKTFTNSITSIQRCFLLIVCYEKRNLCLRIFERSKKQSMIESKILRRNRYSINHRTISLIRDLNIKLRIKVCIQMWHLFEMLIVSLKLTTIKAGSKKTLWMILSNCSLKKTRQNHKDRLIVFLNQIAKSQWVDILQLKKQNLKDLLLDSFQSQIWI